AWRVRRGAGGNAPPWGMPSEARESLRAVVGNRRRGHFVERSVRLRRVPDQPRGVRVDLVEGAAVRREPAFTRAAADGVVERAEGAVALDARAGGVACDLESVAVDLEAGHVAVAEVRGVHEAVVRADGEPAQLGRQPRARVDLDEGADLDLAVLVDRAQHAAVADGLAEDEGVGPLVQEGDVE